MRIKHKDINREIRFEGELLRRISPLGIEKVQRFASPLSTKVLSLLKLKN